MCCLCSCLALFVVKVRNRSLDISLFFLSLRFCHLLDLHAVFLIQEGGGVPADAENWAFGRVSREP